METLEIIIKIFTGEKKENQNGDEEEKSEPKTNIIFPQHFHQKPKLAT